MIDLSISLENINLCFNCVSLFHYFAAYSDILQLFFDKIEIENSKRELTNPEKTIALQILNPDLEGKTALYRAV